METHADWVWIYKVGREALIALAFVAIAFHLFRARNKERFEAPARRMLEEDDG
jgi:cbb3-type cytochrome oxidase subunit 3